MTKFLRDNSDAGGGGSRRRLPSFFAQNCCLYGWYALLVALIVTSGCLLSLYSSAGCEFVSVDVGFIPSNPAFNESQAMLGFFFYKDDETGLGQEGGQHEPGGALRVLHGGCYRYSAKFETDFISPDRTWKVSRIMALIAFFSGLLACILSWLMVVTPLPARTCWPTFLLPLVMLSFIAEGSKFIIFDISACSGSVWLPSGVDSEPQKADSCLLGRSAIAGVASGSLFLVSLLLVCLHTPERRRRVPDDGLPSSTSTVGTALNYNRDDTGAKPGGDESSTEVGPFEDPPEPSSLLQRRQTSVGSMRDIESSDGGGGRFLDEDAFTDGSAANDARSTLSSGSGPGKSAAGNPTGISEEDVSTLQSAEAAAASKRSDADRQQQHEPERISESRLSKVKEMELLHASNYYSQDQSDVLAKLVSELDRSLSMPPDGEAQHQRFL